MALKDRPDQPVLITEAQPSRTDQFNARRRRYVLTMLLRVVCLVGAALTYRIPWLMAILAVTAVVLPWVAVLIANDRPPKKAQKVNRYTAPPDAGRSLDGPPAPDRPRIIDGG